MSELVSLNEDVFPFAYTHELCEGVTDPKSGKAVLARLKGPIFFPDGYSRNKRFYPKNLWKKVVESADHKRRLADGNVYGCIGHDVPLIEKSWREGQISHIVREIYIDENGVGQGVIDVLDTKSGRIINTTARAGSKLFMSSRATGKFTNTPKNGNLVVDPNGYKWETFDFVLQPGFLKATPKLEEDHTTDENVEEQAVEEQKENLDPLTESVNAKIDENEKDTHMSDKVLEKQQQQIGALQKQIDEMAENNQAMKQSNMLLQEKNDSLEEALEAKEKECSLLEGYKNIGGDADTVKASLELSRTQLKVYEKFVAEHGTFAEVAEKLAELKDYQEGVAELGGIETLQENLKTLVDYTRIGKTPNKIKNTIVGLSERLDTYKKVEEANAITNLVETYSVSKERAEKLVAKLGIDEAVDFLTELKGEEAPVTETKRKDGRQFEKTNVNENEQEVEIEESTTKGLFDKDPADAIMEEFTSFANSNTHVVTDHRS